MSRVLIMASVCAMLASLAACQKSPTEKQAEALSDSGRIRADSSQPGALTFWVLTDSIRKGAATNVVDILAEADRRHLVRRR